MTMTSPPLSPEAAFATAAPAAALSLEFQNVTQSFVADGERREVVKDVSFKAEGHEIIAILGPSGCGKSTLLRMVSGLYPRGTTMPTEGEVRLNGELVTGPRDEVLTVFQTPALAGWLSVLGNVELSFRPGLFAPRMRWPWEVAQDLAAAIGDRIPPLRMKIPCSKPMKEVEQRSIDILEAVGLGDALHKFPHQLSGGMKQRVALASALVVRPKVLCMDEPFSALDPTTRIEMRQLVRSLHERYPCLILFITHDVGEALDLADRVLVLSTRPARILGDLRLPVLRSAAWKASPERAAMESTVLQMIREAQGAARLAISV